VGLTEDVCEYEKNEKGGCRGTLAK